MDSITAILQSVNLDPGVLLKSLLILVVGSLILGLIGRFVFGQRSFLSQTVSASISILFIYAIAMVIYSAVPVWKPHFPDLPYITFDGSSLKLFSFTGSSFSQICSQLLSMVILAFLANLLDGLVPNTDNFFLWLLAKSATVIGAIALLLLVNWLLASFVPFEILKYSPIILLILLIGLFMLGTLNLIIGIALTTVNPIIGILYTFFFSTFVGNAITKAMLTTLILSVLVFALSYVGCVTISIAVAALIAYIPLVLILLLVWYVVDHFL